MSGELEDRLDDALSRIAMETQEIKELEQQLTEGQTQVNEALQQDLRRIISGLEVHLRGLTEQAHQAQQKIHRLQLQLEEMSSTHRQDLSVQQGELSELRLEVQSLRDRQVEQGAELQQLRAELRQQRGGDRSTRTRTRTRTRTGTRTGTRTSRLQRSEGRAGLRRHRALCSQGDAHQLQRLSRSSTNQLRALRHMVEASSLGSPGTQDSGLGLQYLSSPERGRQQHRRPAANPDPPPPAPPAPPAPLFLGHTWLLCAPVTCCCPAGGAAPRCNIPEPSTIRRCVCECVHIKAERQEEQKKKVRQEAKQRRHTPRQHRRVQRVCDEVECVEKTLLKRRAELREADRLLLEAHSCIHTCREQQAARDSATCLLEASQLLRELQQEMEELRSRRREEVQRVKEVQEELHQLTTHRHTAGESLAVLLSDCSDSQQHLDSLHSQVEQRRAELQAAQSRLKEAQEEEQRLLSRVQELQEQQEALWSRGRSTASTLRGDEKKLTQVQAELHTHRAELKRVLQELLVVQEVLEEVKTKHSQRSQRLHRKRREEEEEEEVLRCREERRKLQEQCKHLEERHTHTQRVREG